MDNNLEFNEVYSMLTQSASLSEEQNTANFLNSLQYKNNGYKLTSIIMSLDMNDISIVEGFLSTEFAETNYFNEDSPLHTFKSCRIKVNNRKKIKEYTTKLIGNNLVEKAYPVSDEVIEIIIK